MKFEIGSVADISHWNQKYNGPFTLAKVTR